MSQLLKLELLSLLRDTARRMRGNSADCAGGQNGSILSLAIQLEKEARELEIATLSDRSSKLSRPT